MDLIVNKKNVHAATGGRNENINDPVVILIHGAGLNRTIWQLQSRNIAFRGYRVLSVDLPGHGRSDGPALKSISDLAEWTLKFMEKAKVKTATLIGHSMGALVALETAAKAPKKIEQLILMGVAEKMPVHPELLKAAEENSSLAPKLIIHWGLGKLAQKGGHPSPGLWVHSASETLLKQAPENILAIDLNACNAYENGAIAAAQISCPTLLILAREDMMTPVRNGKKLAKKINNSTIKFIEKSGHMMMSERPNKVLNALENFIR